MRCHPFDHQWGWDAELGVSRCENCHCLGEENDYGYMVTIKCYCGAWASHFHEGEWRCHNHGRKRKVKNRLRESL